MVHTDSTQARRRGAAAAAAGRVACAAWVLAAACLGHAQPARAQCQVQQVDVPVRLVDRRPVAQVSLNGTELPMQVDSGAFFSFLSPAAAAELKLQLHPLPAGLAVQGYTGRVEAQRAMVDQVRLEGLALTNLEFVVGGNELGGGVMGMLGRNLLALADTEYDLGQGMLRPSFPTPACRDTNMAELAQWAGDSPVVRLPLLAPRRKGDSAIRVAVQVNGRRLTALLDTGASRTALTLAAARKAGIAADTMVAAGRTGGAGAGAVNSWMAPVALIEVGSEQVRDSQLHVDDVDADGDDLLLGLDYFLSHRLYVSQLQRQLYIRWNGTPIFRRDADATATATAASAAAPLEDVDALARRGAASLSAGKLAQALQDLDEAIARAPAVADYRFTRARIHAQARRPQAALADLDEALRLAPQLADARLRRASLQALLENRAAAEADLRLLDAQLPRSSDLRAGMGRLHDLLGQADSALKQYGDWLDTHPADFGRAALLNSRCWLRARLDRELNLALADCERAVEVDREDAGAHDSLGWVWLRLGDAQAARRAFDKAIRLKPLASSYYGRAVASLRLSLPASGASDLADARRLDPGIDAQLRHDGFGALLGLPAPPAASKN